MERVAPESGFLRSTTSAAVDGDDSSIPGVVNPESLTARLKVTARGDDLFLGWPPRGFNQRVFGGHVMAQAILAASHTVDADRVVNSIHTYFLRPGEPHQPLQYAVTRLRDGRSFSVRSVAVTQAERTLMTCQSLYNDARPPGDVVSVSPPRVPHPESLDPLHERRNRSPVIPDGINRPARAHWWTASRPLDVRYIDDEGPSRRFWFRGQPDPMCSQNEQRALLAFASDRSLLPAIAKARGGIRAVGMPKVASLDHALWFHRDVVAGEWFLYDQESPHSSTGLGTARALIYSLAGDLVASVVQQGLVF